MFIVDIERKKKNNIKVNNKKIKMNLYSKKSLSLIISKNKR